MQGLYLLAVGQTKAGLAVGTTTSAALLLLDIKRAYDVGEPAVTLISNPNPCLISLQALCFPLLCGSEQSSYGPPGKHEQPES